MLSKINDVILKVVGVGVTMGGLVVEQNKHTIYKSPLYFIEDLYLSVLCELCHVYAKY